MEPQKINMVAILSVALTVMVIVALVAGLSPVYHTITNSGNVKTIGISVYSNQECTTVLNSISWGNLEKEKSYTRDFWVKNTGNSRVKLNMTTENWSPSNAKNYLTLTWDLEGLVLEVNQQPIKGTFTLRVASNAASGNFSFTIVITGTEY
ncbi:MAG: hypothetical protein QXQ94_06830 [Candidatus Bathyarchaeia archaeon]